MLVLGSTSPYEKLSGDPQPLLSRPGSLLLLQQKRNDLERSIL